MTAIFNELFQDRVTFIGVEPMSVQAIAEALHNSYLHQFDAVESRVESIGKDIVKQFQLWQMPRLVFNEETQEWVLGGGRHRIRAIVDLVNNYGVNAAGKLVKLDNETDLEIDAIEPVIQVMKFKVRNTKDLVQFLQTDNGSRSMTAAERLEGKVTSNSLTPAENLKLKLAKALQAALDTTYTFTRVNKDKTTDEVEVEITADTIRQISIKLASAVGAKFKYAVAENFQVLAEKFASFLEETSTQYDSNFSRNGFKEACESFTVVEYDGVLLNADGEELEDPTWLDWYRTTIKTPTKKTKASEMAEKLAKLEAMLAKQGITVDL
ncbi:hypothetical protein [Leptolyngbya phage Lbo240-yong1]|uniref:Uncharacterized protein n=1 Tax=Leptolyngbya phage Lbo240-yong1 TaxID=2928836 RepID=A0A9X9E5G3_9CAUD|nr:hypothetical protein [Leptolyngbya phage Lbo240-yong1]